MLHGPISVTLDYINAECVSLRNKLDEYICSYVHRYYASFVYSYHDRLEEYVTFEDIMKIEERIHDEMLSCLSVVELSSSTCIEEFKKFILKEIKKRSSELYQSLR